jgi:uncharacterized protein
MPANLTPQYHKAELQYRQAQTPDEELRCLELMLRELPKHKGTDKLQADLKSKISKARHEVELARKSAHGRRVSVSQRIPRQGAGRAVLVGGPNSGKSSLLKALTRATPEIAPYPFTTREPQPGMMSWEDIAIQLIDTPPITAELLDPALPNLIRSCNLALFVVDLAADEGIEQMQAVVDRLAATKTRLARLSSLDPRDVGVSHTRTLLVLNKIDAPGADERQQMIQDLEPPGLPICMVSAERGSGLEELKKAIFEGLDIVRIYTRQPSSKSADLDKPFTLRRGSTVIDVAQLIHERLAASFKHARVWSHGATSPVTVKGDHVVDDRDIVEIHSG